MSVSREQALFALALENPAEDRAAFLARECAGDAVLRRRVEPLLAAHDQAVGSFPIEAGAPRDYPLFSSLARLERGGLTPKPSPNQRALTNYTGPRFRLSTSPLVQ